MQLLFKLSGTMKTEELTEMELELVTIAICKEIAMQSKNGAFVTVTALELAWRKLDPKWWVKYDGMKSNS